MAKKTVSFLNPDPEQIKNQIRGILDSYSHDWDLFAELSQNAVDSIARADPTRGHVRILIDATKKTVGFTDNGTGIDPASIEKLLRPFGTDKRGATNQIGNKGVGLTFVLFSTASFVIESHHANGSVRATVQGANAWIKSDEGSELFVQIEEIEPAPCGVKISIVLSGDDHPIWALHFSQLLFILRTRTALGNTKHIWGEPLNCDVNLTHTDISGNLNSKEFDCNYLLPTEGLKKEESLSIDEYISWLSESDRSDRQKRLKLSNKIVYQLGTKYQAGRDLRFWACFVPNRSQWTKLSAHFGLIDPQDPANEQISDEVETGFVFSGGLLTSSKGMPTGINVDLKPRGSAGYLPNFFILIEDPSLSFDIGRKAIQGRQQAMLREVSFEQFRVFLNMIVKYISGTVDDPAKEYDRETLFNEIQELPDLNSSTSRFIKRPDSQEATIAAMFFEHLGKGGFSGYSPYISGYRGRYDLYGKISGKSNVLEFKFDMAGLFKDFTDERKMFDEINTLVVWEITERDRKLSSARGLTITEFSGGVLDTTKSVFPGAHCRLDIDGIRPIEVVMMKKLVKPD